MSDPKAGVRQILDRVKADKRSSLTAPEGKAGVRSLRYSGAQGSRGEVRRRRGERAAG
jgi:hypothetical protein